MKSEDLETEYIVVTREVWILLWDLRARWRMKRLSNVIKYLIENVDLSLIQGES